MRLSVWCTQDFCNRERGAQTPRFNVNLTHSEMLQELDLQGIQLTVRTWKNATCCPSRAVCFVPIHYRKDGLTQVICFEELQVCVGFVLVFLFLLHSLGIAF